MANERQVKAVANAARLAENVEYRMAYNAWVHVACVAQSVGLTASQYRALLERLGYKGSTPCQVKRSA